MTRTIAWLIAIHGFALGLFLILIMIV